MLPDLPPLKASIRSYLDRYLQERIRQQMGIFNQAAKYVIHEGSRMRTIRSDNSVDECTPKESGASVSISLDKVPEYSINERKTLLDGIAESMAGQMNQSFIEQLDESLKDSGQVSDGGGRPLDVEGVFAALEKIDIDFDEFGQPSELTVLIPPALEESARRVLEDMKSSEEIGKRYDDLIERKKRDWNDRETGRELVG